MNYTGTAWDILWNVSMRCRKRKTAHLLRKSSGDEDKASLQSEQNLHASPVQWTMWPMQHKLSKQLSKIILPSHKKIHQVHKAYKILMMSGNLQIFQGCPWPSTLDESRHLPLGVEWQLHFPEKEINSVISEPLTHRSTDSSNEKHNISSKQFFFLNFYILHTTLMLHLLLTQHVHNTTLNTVQLHWLH